jgi:hypothetical protein
MRAKQQGETRTITPDRESKESYKDSSIDSEKASESDATESSDGGAEEEEPTIDRVVVDYASKSAGGLVLESSPSMKGASNLLTSDQDKYAISPCEDKKKVVIGLSEDILVKQVKLANYERYSSQVHEFQISGSQTMGNWVDLGTYKADQRNGEQTFDLLEPAWARYLTFRFLSHYGQEHYCTISQIKVHGSTMLQGFHEQWKDNEEEIPETDDDDDGDGIVVVPVTKDEQTPSGSTGSDITDVVEKEASEGSLMGQEQLSGSMKMTDESPLEAMEEADAKAEVDDGEKSGPGPSTKEDAEVESVPSASIADESSEFIDVISPQSESGDTQGDLFSSERSSKVVAVEKEDMDETVPQPGGLPSEAGKAASFLRGGLSQPSLSSASIETAAQRAASAPMGGNTPQLGTDARLKDVQGSSVIDSVKNVVAEASGALKAIKDAPTVSDALHGIQEKLKSVKGADVRIDQPLREASPSDEADTDEELPEEASGRSEPPEVVSVDDTTSDAEPIADKSTSDSSSLQTDEDIHHSQEPAEETSKPTVIGKTATPIVPDDSAIPSSETTKQPEAEVPAKIIEVDPALTELLSRFPSASCLNDLHFSEFKAKVLAARKGSPAGGGAPVNAAAGRLEPIFKTLTDEIKALQVNNSAQKHYSRALVACYQQIMFEIMSELDGLQRQHDARLADLERAVSEMQSSDFTTFCNELATGVFVLMSAVAANLWFEKALLAVPFVALLGMSLISLVAKRRRYQRDSLSESATPEQISSRIHVVSDSSEPTPTRNASAPSLAIECIEIPDSLEAREDSSDDDEDTALRTPSPPSPKRSSIETSNPHRENPVE